jgi:hypothetical protein
MAHVAAPSIQRTVSSAFDPVNQKGGSTRCNLPSGGCKWFSATALPSNSEPTVWTVFLKYLKTASGAKNAFLKVIYTFSDWVVTFLPHMTVAKDLSKLTKDAKNTLAGAELPEKSKEVVDAAANLVRKGDVGSLGNLTNKMSLFAMPAIDFLKVVSAAVRPLTEATMRTVNTVFNSATVFSTTYGTGEELMKVRAEEAKGLKGRLSTVSQANITQSWLKIGMYVNYFAIGALGLATLFAGLAVKPWVILALATSGLAFTLLTHFHEKLRLEPAVAKMQPAFSAKV